VSLCRLACLGLTTGLRLFLRQLRSPRAAEATPEERLPHELHNEDFGWALALVAGHDLAKAERIGFDRSIIEANAELRTTARRGNGETYREMRIRPVGSALRGR